MLHAHTRVPCMEPFEQDRLQLKRVVRRRVGNAHHLREDQEHEEVVLVALGACDRPSIWGVVELRGQIGPPAKSLSDVRPRQVRQLADAAAVADAFAARRSLVNAAADSRSTKIDAITMTRSSPARMYWPLAIRSHS